MKRIAAIQLSFLIILASYLVSAQNQSGSTWIISQHDLNIELPKSAHKEGDHRIEIARQFDNEKEEMMLRKAEAVYPDNKESDFWKSGVRPQGEISAISVASAGAVRYYLDISEKLRIDDRMADSNSFRYSQTNLKYNASIKYYAAYKHAEKVFDDVNVAVIELEWSHSCGSLCGLYFKRKKLVILDSTGKIVALVMDFPENNRITVS